MEQLSSAGTLIAAILESAGYHWQAQILDALQSPFRNELGGLVYLVGVLIALFMTATQGGFKMGAWLLIGPPLFFATVLDRKEISNAQWMFGNSPRPQAKVSKELNKMLGGNINSSNVSRLFARYTEVVSKVDQEIVATISKGRNRADYWFILKAELFSQIHTSREIEPGLKHLLHYGLIGQCEKLIMAAKKANSPMARSGGNGVGNGSQEFSIDQKQAAQKAKEEYDAEYKVATVKINEDPAARYIAEKIAERENDYFFSEEQMREIRDTRVITTAFSCAQIWEYVLQGIRERVWYDLHELEQKGKDYGVERGPLLNMMAQAEGIPTGGNIAYTDKDGNAQQAFSADNVEKIVDVMAKYYLRNEVTNPSFGGALSRYISRLDLQRIRTRGVSEGYGSYTERSRMGLEEWSERERMINAAVSLPYYQGLGLYFLAIAFPFFALLLLMPGRHGGFLLWFTLWFWVKSWDIGFAIVMLLDDMVFSLLAVQKLQIGKDPTIPEDMGLAFASLREIDPTFQMTTYYSIIAVCILAIPVVTAQVIMGGLKGGAGLIAEGMDRSSEFATQMPLGYMQQMVATNMRMEQKMGKEAQIASTNAQIRAGVNPFVGANDPRNINVVHDAPLNPPTDQRKLMTEGTFEGRNSGIAQGMTKPERLLSEAPSSNAENAFRALYHSGALSTAKAATIKSQLEAENKYLATLAAWLFDRSPEAIERFQTAGIANAIAIPYTQVASVEPSQLQFNLHQRLWKNKWDIEAAENQSLQELWSALLGAAEENITSAWKAKSKAQGGLDWLGSDERQQALSSISPKGKENMVNSLKNHLKAPVNQVEAIVALYLAGTSYSEIYEMASAVGRSAGQLPGQLSDVVNGTHDEKMAKYFDEEVNVPGVKATNDVGQDVRDAVGGTTPLTNDKDKNR